MYKSILTHAHTKRNRDKERREYIGFCVWFVEHKKAEQNKIKKIYERAYKSVKYIALLEHIHKQSKALDMSVVGSFIHVCMRASYNQKYRRSKKKHYMFKRSDPIRRSVANLFRFLLLQLSLHRRRFTISRSRNYNSVKL